MARRAMLWWHFCHPRRVLLVLSLHAQSLRPTFHSVMPEIVLAAGTAILRGVSRIVQPLGTGAKFHTASAEEAVCREAAETWREIGIEMSRSMGKVDSRLGSHAR